MFFEEFEDYIFDRYGEKSYLKTLLENTLLPLKEALEEITSERIIESLFGTETGNGTNPIKKPMDKLASVLGSLIPPVKSGTIPTINPQNSGPPEKEKGLIQNPTIEIEDISDVALQKIQAILSISSNQKELKTSENSNRARIEVPEEEGGGGLIGKLLGGLLGLGGLAVAAYGFMEDGPWKGSLKLLGKTMLSALGSGLKTFFTAIGDKLKDIGKIFTESKAFKIISSKIGLDGLLDTIKNSKIFSFLSKGIGKSALKKIWGIGTILSFAYAYSRFKDGDTVGGFMEIASGIGSMFPGIGTAIAIGIDLLIALKDFATGGTKNAAHMSVKEQAKAMLNSLPTFISENLSKFAEWIKEKAAEFLLPKWDWLMEKKDELIKTMAEKWEDVKDKLAEEWEKVKEKIKNFPKWLGEQIGRSIKGTINLAIKGVKNTILGAKKVNEFVQERGGWIKYGTDLSKISADAIINHYKKMYELSSEGISKLYDATQKMVDAQKAFILDVYAGLDSELHITDAVSSVYNVIKKKYYDILDLIKDKIIGGMDAILKFISFGKLEAKKESVGKIVDTAGHFITGGLFMEKNKKENSPKVNPVEKEKMPQIKEATGRDNSPEELKKEIQLLQELVVGGLNENSQVFMQGSNMVAQTIAATSKGGGENVNVVNNNMATSSPISNFRRDSAKKITN